MTPPPRPPRRFAPVLLPVSLAATLAVALAACSSSDGGAGGPSSGGGSTVPSSTVPSSTVPSSTVPSSTAPVSSTAVDYTTLLIDAADIPVPGFTEGTPSAPPQGSGATVAFTGSGGRTLGDTLLVLPDATTAKAAAQQSVAAARQGIPGAEVTAAPIGGGGTALRGTKDGNAVAVLVFTEGRALVVLEFDSSAADPVPTSVVQQVATTQDTKIKAGLPA